MGLWLNSYDRKWLISKRPLTRGSYRMNQIQERSGIVFWKYDLTQSVSIDQALADRAVLSESKGQVGVDCYEHRSWPAWHRHMTYVFLALQFMLWMRLHF